MAFSNEVILLKKKGYKTISLLCKEIGRKTSLNLNKLPKKFFNYEVKTNSGTYFPPEIQEEIKKWLKLTSFQKRKETNLSKYNTDSFSKLSSFKEKLSKSKRCTTEIFIKKAIKKHKEDYDYSKVTYGKNAYEKIEIICKKHGSFFMTPHNFLRGQNCPKCSLTNFKSAGEKRIENFLNKNKIRFKEQKRFFFIKNKKTLPFDFYLPDYNLIIEFQGRQHYEKVLFFKNDLEYQKTNDNIKKQSCLKNDIIFVEINYKEKNIEEILSEYLGIW